MTWINTRDLSRSRFYLDQDSILIGPRDLSRLVLENLQIMRILQVIFLRLADLTVFCGGGKLWV